MRWFVVLPGALVPASIAADLTEACGATPFASELLRSPRRPDEAISGPGASPHWQWLWRAFGGEDSAPVTAPYLTSDPGTAQWWSCDPLHVEIGRDQLRVGRRRDAQMRADEAAALHEQAADALNDVGALFYAEDGRWLLRLHSPWRIEALDLDAARGRSISVCLPQGPDAAHWSRLQNEVQMRWHAHPVNAAREARGEAPINALWLHGGGTWQRLPRTPFAAIASNDPLLRGWARAAGLTDSALQAEPDLPARGDAVSLWPDLQEPSAFESWSEWLDRFSEVAQRLAALKRRAFAAAYASIEIVLCGRATVRTVSLDRYAKLRFWRPTSSGALAGLLAEPPR